MWQDVTDAMSSSVTGSQELMSEAHRFSVTSFIKPIKCHYCTSLMLGLERQGVVCQGLLLNIYVSIYPLISDLSSWTIFHACIHAVLPAFLYFLYFLSIRLFLIYRHSWYSMLAYMQCSQRSCISCIFLNFFPFLYFPVFFSIPVFSCIFSHSCIFLYFW